MTTESQKKESGLMPGFTGFHKFDKGGQHFFEYHSAGLVLLSSPPYPNAEKRDQAFESFRRNAADTGHYAELEQEGAYYFAVKAGNHKELARSSSFSSSAERTRTMKFVQDAIAKEIQSGGEGEKVTPSHYRFILSFYPDKTDKFFRGKIEYPFIKDDKESFEGIDMDQIGRFIRERLPQPESSSRSPATKIKGIPISRPLEIFGNGMVVRNSRIDHNQSLEVEMTLKGFEEKWIPGNSINARLIIKPLEQRGEVVTVSSTLPASNELRVKAPAHDLPLGLYRIILHAEINNSEKTQNEISWEGSSLILIS